VPADDADEEKDGAAPQRLTIAEHADMVTSDLLSREPYMSASLSVVVVGASGDLAKKKTYPALLGEFQDSKKHAPGVGGSLYLTCLIEGAEVNNRPPLRLNLNQHHSYRFVYPPVYFQPLF